MVSSKASWLWGSGDFGAGRDAHLEYGNGGAGGGTVNEESQSELPDSELFR
jgi:hypothetical protein